MLLLYITTKTVRGKISYREPEKSIHIHNTHTQCVYWAFLGETFEEQQKTEKNSGTASK